MDRERAYLLAMKRALLPLITLAAMLATAAAEPTIFIVRHAEKAIDGDAKDPLLSEAGRARAESLATTLKDAGITAIYATEFKRTQLTAEPLARADHLETTIVPARETERLIEKLKTLAGNALVVAHSNTIPEIVKALGASLNFTIEEADYDNLLVLRPGTAELIRLHYR
jgi:probable phosphoglycerate mutase